MRVLGILAMLTLLGVGGVVGARLLRLARRTGELPELSLGSGLLLVSLGGAVAALSRIPALLATAPGDALLAVGLAVTASGIAFFYVFTWRVFRPSALWAMWLVVLASGALGVQWRGLLQATAAGGATMESIVPHTRPWGVAITAMVALGFLWTGLEAGAYFLRLRRRRAVGLADPVLENRFALWSLSGFAVALLCSALIGSMLAGLAPMRHPLPLWTVGSAALVVSAAWTLTFLPPARYLDWLRERSSAGDQVRA